ncbi:hypothetical protein D3H65_27400 [Paraflavitalea soli]|uniref:Uncharacterized protein n=1 Tax=Paraflavitalea soli TaxID=2315862 RepID=A0A3B7MSJ4_9BACT|nr:hypothetical protein [Paraflavitalea soli]AXY77482.1 hypothetical protein D3H65_27400 [Paraflavitalea soli]
MSNSLRNFIKRKYKKFYQKFHYDTFKVLQNQGRLLAAQNSTKHDIQSLEEVEFQVFSQRGEDGILQYIISKIDIPYKIFIEFGVEDYTESNTRYLLINNNWSGMVIDGSDQNIKFIKDDFIYWKYDLTAVHSFITKENINSLISNYTNCKDIGLLSVDIDGNDYWVWETIDVIQPRIVVCEYNSTFGATQKVSTPYKADFTRSGAHYSDLYFGASLAAFCHLAEKKGYDFIGTAGYGVNAFFVRKDLSAPFRKYQAEEEFRVSAGRDSRDEKRNLSFLRHEQRLAVIKDLPVVDVTTGNTDTIRNIYHI